MQLLLLLEPHPFSPRLSSMHKSTGQFGLQHDYDRNNLSDVVRKVARSKGLELLN